MPEGPAIGRVEAKRRALTMPSTAPASSARWWRGSIRVRDRILFRRRVGRVREPTTTRIASPLLPSDPCTTCARGRRDSPARIWRADTDTGHDQRWRERPRQGALGSGAGHGSGVVHAIVVAATSARALFDEAADSAASWSLPPQRTSRQAFVCGSCSWPTRGERASGDVLETGGPT
jgi:hypothetical protein